MSRPRKTMKRTLNSDLEIRDVPGKGRGVFATRAFAKGEVIDVAPVILGNGPREELPAWVEHFVYNWRAIGGRDADHAIALGYGSLYNSSTEANASFRAAETNDAIEYRAHRDIRAGEQVTINYSSFHGEAVCHDNTWFSERGIDYRDDD